MKKKALNPLENHDPLLYTRHFLLFDWRHCAHRQYSAYRGKGAEKTADEYGSDGVGDDRSERGIIAKRTNRSRTSCG